MSLSVVLEFVPLLVQGVFDCLSLHSFDMNAASWHALAETLGQHVLELVSLHFRLRELQGCVWLRSLCNLDFSLPPARNHGFESTKRPPCAWVCAGG